MKGFIFDIKKYSINDGPGIRTTVFFKGCPLRCWWCHNPESQRALPEEHSECTFRWNYSNQAGSKNVIGTEISSVNLAIELEKDRPFYEESNGGVTFSGGEPVLQIEFLDSMLTYCSENDIHTAVDTTGYTDYKNLDRIFEKTSLFLYDLKLMKDDDHIKYTGVSNKIIHENLKRLSDSGNKIILRIPIVPGINDSGQNIDSLIEYISSLKKIRGINLLPYHKSANNKYVKMKIENKLSDVEPPTDLQMEQLKNKFSSLGCEVKIGG